MKKLIEILQREDNALSLIRVIILLAALEFLVLTPYVIVENVASPMYPVFSGVLLILIFCGIYKYNVESQQLSLKLSRQEGDKE